MSTFLESLAEAIKALFSKVGDFFDVFDLSFFISGGVALLALLFLSDALGLSWPADAGGAAEAAAETAAGAVGADAASSEATTISTTVVLVLSTYVMGLVTFAVGRSIRRLLPLHWVERMLKIPSGQSEEHLATLLRAQDFGAELDRIHASQATALATIYPRLWAKLRQTAELGPSFALIRSYWVRSAIYDGLVAAAGLWLVALWSIPDDRVMELWTRDPRGLISWMIGFAAVFCMSEARRCDRYQREELIATLGWARSEERSQKPPTDTGPDNDA